MFINKLTAATLSNNLEVAPALANLNFDFALWKVEAPKEFDGVVSALSSVRREKAENGMLTLPLESSAPCLEQFSLQPQT